MDKIRTIVKIAGKDYTITSYDSEEHVQRVAAYVNRRMEELSAASRMAPTQLAVLTAVNAVDEMVKAKDEARALRAELTKTREENEALRLELEKL